MENLDRPQENDRCKEGTFVKCTLLVYCNRSIYLKKKVIYPKFRDIMF